MPISMGNDINNSYGEPTNALMNRIFSEPSCRIVTTGAYNKH